MYFKRLEMQGFKSFADPVTIELNDGITCIVGPNGSGKSNISDALRWVLGEQNPRSLRGSKMDDVIFSGTATRKPKGMAEVSLVIDNSDGILPVEYSEVAVTRRMYRSGESEYLINGNPCRLRDIKEMFMDTGIGVDGYSIIGQGRIADIVSTKPENRREIFEEAAGVTMYKSRKAEAERKLSTASDNLERVKDILNEIEGRIGGLKEDSEKASEYLVLRDRYKHLSINIILHNMESLEKSVKASETELSELEERFQSKIKAQEELEKVIENQRVRDAELSMEMDNSNRTLLEKIEELNLITNRGQLNTEKLSAIERDLARLFEDIKEFKDKLEIETNNYNSLHENEVLFDKEREKAEESLNEAIFRLNEHQKKLSITSEELEKNRSSILELGNANVAKKAEITTLENYKNTLNERKLALSDEYEGRDEIESSNRARLSEVSRLFEEKNAKFKELNEKTEEIGGKIISVNTSVSDLSKALEEITIEINRLSARKSTIEEMEANYEGYNNSVKQVMQKSFRGVIGTVSDLISVPEKYTLAIETALGQQIQNVVCEDDAAAKNAIEWLKSSKSGRVTFLPVKSITSDPIPLSDKTTGMPGYIGLASDLVKADSKYDEIVEYLLCRVIIADNMDNAIKISKTTQSGFRIVSLEGEIISPYGSITGGAFKNKSANLLDRKNEIAELSKEIEALSAKLDESRKKRNEAEDKLKDLKEKRYSFNQEIQQIEIELNVLKADKEHAEEIVRESGDAMEKNQKEIESIKQDIERASTMIEKYTADIEASEAEIKKLEELTGELIVDNEKYRGIVEADNEEIVKCRLSLQEKETKILSQNEMIEMIRDSITELEINIEEATNESDELEKQRNLLTSSGVNAGEQEETLKREKTELEEKIAKLQSDIDENRTKHEEAIRDQKNAALEIDELRDTKYKLELKSTKNETLLGTQKDKLWDEFEVSYAEAVDMREENFGITSGNREVKEIRLRMAELGDVNISAIEEYKQVSKRYEFMTAQRDDINKAMDELNTIISNMDKTIKEKFKENFDKVVVYFEESFSELFGGGTAELRLEDESDPLESGIEIIAQPPGKRLKNINLMSGGEKTLTAIALMFAVLKAKPTPFCILDEVEAALDEANIERFSEYLKKFDDVQFALITHQKATMEHADVLYGVTMPEQGITRLLSLRLGDEFDVVGLA